MARARDLLHRRDRRMCARTEVNAHKGNELRSENAKNHAQESTDGVETT